MSQQDPHLPPLRGGLLLSRKDGRGDKGGKADYPEPAHQYSLTTSLITPWRIRLWARMVSTRRAWLTPKVRAEREMVFFDQRLQERLTSMKRIASVAGS